jgi:hypothetical protein
MERLPAAGRLQCDPIPGGEWGSQAPTKTQHPGKTWENNIDNIDVDFLHENTNHNGKGMAGFHNLPIVNIVFGYLLAASQGATEALPSGGTPGRNQCSWHVLSPQGGSDGKLGSSRQHRSWIQHLESCGEVFPECWL